MLITYVPKKYAEDVRVALFSVGVGSLENIVSVIFPLKGLVLWGLLYQTCSWRERTREDVVEERLEMVFLLILSPCNFDFEKSTSL